jgi:hypothetical protein
MRPDAMTIPARLDADGSVARAAQAGPVFSVEHGACTCATPLARAASSGTPTRWCSRPRPAERAAGRPRPGVLSVRLQPGMGLVGHNVLHDRSAFVDDPAPAPAVPRPLPGPRVADEAQG